MGQSEKNNQPPLYEGVERFELEPIPREWLFPQKEIITVVRVVYIRTSSAPEIHDRRKNSQEKRTSLFKSERLY